MKNCFDFFLCEFFEEKQILDFLKYIFGLEISSPCYENNKAIGYMQFLEFNGDIKISFTAIFPNSIKLNTSEEKLARKISNEFKTEVIFYNPDTSDKRKFLMVDAFGSTYALNIKDEDEDGEVLDEFQIIDKIHVVL